MMSASALRSEGESLDLPAHVRAKSGVRLGVAHADGRTRITARREEGALRLRFPNGPEMEALLVNIGGGFAGGDTAELAIHAGAGARLALSSATAERIYRSAGDVTEIALTLTAEAGANLVWLPYETILHEGARLRRKIDLALDVGARLLMAETVHFGRRARGEVFGQGHFRESWRLRIGGRLVYADETRLDGQFGEALARPGALGAMSILTTMILAGADAAERLDALREALAPFSAIEAGASALAPNLVILRLLGAQAPPMAAALRAAIRAAAPLTLPLPRLFLTTA